MTKALRTATTHLRVVQPPTFTALTSEHRKHGMVETACGKVVRRDHSSTTAARITCRACIRSQHYATATRDA